MRSIGSQARNLDTHFEQQENGWIFSPALVSLAFYSRRDLNH